MRPSDTAETKTVDMARVSAKLPRVNGPTELQLRYSREYLDRKASRPPQKSALRKFFEILDPRAWTLAFIFSALFTSSLGLFLHSTYRRQSSLFKAPLFPVLQVTTQLQWGLAICVALTLLIFHFLLNYRRRGRGGLIKAYWYAAWAFAFGFFFLPQVHRPISQHRANQINEYCFVNKKSEKCSRYLALIYKGQRPRDVLQLLPDKKQNWVKVQFAKLDPPIVALNEARRKTQTKAGTAVQLKTARRLASPIALPH